MNKSDILEYLRVKKHELEKYYGITALGLYGSYATDEATPTSEIDIFYKRDKNFELPSGFDFLNLSKKIATDLKVESVDFVSLDSMNPIIKHYAEKDFIYV